MRYLFLILLTVLAVIVEAWPGAFYTVYGVRPALTLIIVVYLALEHDWRDALGPMFLVGLVRDAFSGFVPGFYAGSYLVVGWLASGLRQAVLRQNPVSQFVFTLLAALAVNTGGWAVVGLREGFEPALWMYRVLPAAVYTAVLAPFVYPFLRRTGRLLSFESLWRIGVAPEQPRGR